MPEVHPKDFLDDQYPPKFRPQIPTTLKNALGAAELLRKNEPILQIASAEDNFGRIVAWAVDLALVRAIESGALPFDYKWESFAKPTGRYLAIRLQHSVMTVSLVQSAATQPRSVVFRDWNRRFNRQLDFLSELDQTPLEPIQGLPHILLLHGYRDPQFAHLGIPAPDNAKDFSYRTDNLFDLPHNITQEGPPPEDTDTDFEVLQLLKEDIEKWRRDNET